MLFFTLNPSVEMRTIELFSAAPNWNLISAGMLLLLTDPSTYAAIEAA